MREFIAYLLIALAFVALMMGAGTLVARADTPSAGAGVAAHSVVVAGVSGAAAPKWTAAA
ncbi:hypothetical protein [Nocardia sp. NBC_01327]|uniref:hypothetical protein n=1 Tax=Nocardia sp. NBC_01327 TaxID=2903593 RepID=UPI002E0E4928|nr:hypothetical protein OG326_11105 [Nocardia sp. NBC_01327]